MPRSPPRGAKDKRDTATWMNLKCMLLSEISQTQSATHCRIHSHDILEKAKRHGWERLSGCQRLADREGGDRRGDAGDVRGAGTAACGSALSARRTRHHE